MVFDEIWLGFLIQSEQIMEVDPNEIDLDKENDDVEIVKETKSQSQTKKKKKKKPKIQFRNYIPKCEKLRKKYCVPPAKFIEIKDEFTELIEKAKVLNHDIHDIAPKKANWDLKRDCQEQLDELKYLTQLALRKMVGMLMHIIFSTDPCTKLIAKYDKQKKNKHKHLMMRVAMMMKRMKVEITALTLTNQLLNCCNIVSHITSRNSAVILQKNRNIYAISNTSFAHCIICSLLGMVPTELIASKPKLF